MYKVLFVCLGNICRSPSAEGVFRHLVEAADLTDQIHIDSCGTLDHHQGESADPRMRAHAIKRGYDLTSIARGIVAKDFEEFDLILTMDHNNYQDVMAMARMEEQGKIKMMTDFCQNHQQNCVPDPYYGGPEGFELVLDLLEDACAGLLEEVKNQLTN
jgi:protein-tyrosine phosphatase